MAERGADIRGTLGMVVTQAFPGTLGSQVGAKFRGLYLTPDKPDLRDQLLGDWLGQGLREHAVPIADRDLQGVGLCTVRPMGIVLDPGIGPADAAHGSPGRMAMGIRDGAATRIPMSSIRGFTTGEIRATLIMGLVMLAARTRAMRI